MNRTSRAHLNVEAQTHAGMTGKNNEDRYAVASFVLSPREPLPVLFAVLADGIGGHKGGEVAAELAVNHIVEVVGKSDGNNTQYVIESAIADASNAIAARSSADEHLRGMGSTCATAWVIGDKLHTAYVGDSRIYLMRGGRIQQLSVDHTWVQEAIERKILTPEEAREHPNVHVIRRYLGSPVPPEPDFRMKLFNDESNEHALSNQGLPLQPADVILLCSDGLTDLVWNDEILEIVRSKPNLKEAASTLIALANSRGGHDNVTVVLIGVPANFKLKEVKKTNWFPWIVGGIAGLIFLLGAASILAFSLLRRTSVVASTSTSPPPPATWTSPAPPSPTLPSTLIPEINNPLSVPTLTPWPTNTIAATP